jgi:hypothetical protein
VLLTLPAILLVIFSIARINSSTKIRNLQFVRSNAKENNDFVCLFTTFKPEERKMQVDSTVLLLSEYCLSHKILPIINRTSSEKAPSSPFLQTDILDYGDR